MVILPGSKSAIKIIQFRIYFLKLYSHFCENRFLKKQTKLRIIPTIRRCAENADACYVPQVLAQLKML